MIMTWEYSGHQCVKSQTSLYRVLRIHDLTRRKKEKGYQFSDLAEIRKIIKRVIKAVRDDDLLYKGPEPIELVENWFGRRTAQ